MARLKFVEKLFAQAIKFPAGRQREKWIAENCDSYLELELRRLIAAHEGVGEFLSKSAVEIENENKKNTKTN